jgi:alanine dehydrogenase
MQIGLPKEIKDHEFRVALTPANVRELIDQGHPVWVEKNAGAAIGFSDKNYEEAGAILVATAREVFAQADMIVKVKEPQAEECLLLRKDQILFTFLHLAANPKLSELLLASGCIAFAYETVTDDHGALPLLAPMSEIAGRFSVQAGAHYLEKTQGGRGILLGGISGVPPAKVLILGAGKAGSQALKVAVGMGAKVTILNKSLKLLEKLVKLSKLDKSQIDIGLVSPETVAQQVASSDLVIAAVLLPGATTPKLVSREMLQTMKPGSVVVDVSIDQGGCFETSRPTTHSDPTYIEEGIIHYCVTNMPGAVPLTASLALTNVTFPFIMQLANLGYQKACFENRYLMQGLNIFKGQITHPVVAKALDKSYRAPESFL